MNTAVQLRAGNGGAPTADLLAGVPWRLVDAPRGSVALFRPGALVAYRLRVDLRRVSLFLFRTLDRHEMLSARVPGVSPRVRLLATVRSSRNVSLVERLFADLARRARDPSAYPDAVYVRVGAALSRRSQKRPALSAVLERAF